MSLTFEIINYNLLTDNYILHNSVCSLFFYKAKIFHRKKFMESTARCAFVLVSPAHNRRWLRWAGDKAIAPTDKGCDEGVVSGHLMISFLARQKTIISSSVLPCATARNTLVTSCNYYCVDQGWFPQSVIRVWLQHSHL